MFEMSQVGSLAVLSAYLFTEENPRQDVQNQYGQGDKQSAAPSQTYPVIVGAHGELKDHHRQIGHGPAHVGAVKLVVQGSEQKRRSFAADACKG
jgi:hypothetical protein